MMRRREFLVAGSWCGAALAVPRPVLADARLPRTLPMTTAVRQRLSLDHGWRFHEGDIPFPVVSGHGWTYANAKAGNAWGAAAPGFDDSAWRELALPHDFVVEQPFDRSANLSQGYRKRGIAWYRRALRIDAADRGKHLELQFDGVASNAVVWFNGTVVDRNWSGYNSFSIDITPFVRYGDHSNSLVVRVDADAMEGWWYEGGGLYRHVWLVKRRPVHIVTDGVHADPRQGADGRWTVPASVTVENSGETTISTRVEVELRDPEGVLVAQATTEITVDPLERGIATLSLPVPSPQLWSVDAPVLYNVAVRLSSDGQETDATALRIGFRSIAFDAEKGFFLNGKPMKIHGVCVHQDHAGVGVAVPDSLWDFRIRRLKEMGCNAIRISHHAPARELLDACDARGMLVLDENRVFNPTPDFMEQLEWLIRRDRNRPSVFMWSVFNEEPMQGTEAGYQMVRRMVAAVKQLDDSRPVTAAMNDGQFAPVNVSQAVDVVGFNYQQDKYDRFHAEHPGVPILSTEDTSAFQTRGAWQTDRAAHVMASDDSEAAEWGNTHRKAWKLIAEREFVAGAFVWTGFDYRGEPTPFDWPSASSFFGIMDLCGFPKAAYSLHQAQWVRDRPVLKLAPHWNWPGREGQSIKVIAYSNAEEVELWLNGHSLGRQRVDPYEMNEWQVAYAPGILQAAAYRDGEEIARTSVETTGEPARLRLTADRAAMAGDGRDAQPVTVEALDSRGRPVPTANLPVDFDIEGARIIGLGNGDPNSHEPDKGRRRRLFNGLAQVIVQTDPGTRGTLRLRATTPGLRAAELRVDLRATASPPAVPLASPAVVVEGWKHAPFSVTRPDPAQQASDNDQNSWQWVQPGWLQPSSPVDGYVLYRTRFTPHVAVQQHGGRLRVGRLTGPAEVWLDGVKIAQTLAGDKTLDLLLPAKMQARDLAVLLTVPAGEEFGFRDVVTVSVE